MNETSNNGDNSPSRRPKKYGHRYPWRKWFALPAFTLVYGVDFAGRAYTMAQQIRNAAGPRRHNVKVSIHITDDERMIIVNVRRRGRRVK